MQPSHECDSDGAILTGVSSLVISIRYFIPALLSAVAPLRHPPDLNQRIQLSSSPLQSGKFHSTSGLPLTHKLSRLLSSFVPPSEIGMMWWTSSTGMYLPRFKHSFQNGCLCVLYNTLLTNRNFRYSTPYPKLCFPCGIIQS